MAEDGSGEVSRIGQHSMFGEGGRSALSLPPLISVHTSHFNLIKFQNGSPADQPLQ
jgi:hypothetical protein